MQLIRGQKTRLSDLITQQNKIFVKVEVNSPFTADVALFGLDNQQKLSNEAYMIFYNQPVSPCQALKLQQNDGKTTIFEINLAQLAHQIHHMMITITIDDSSPSDTMSKLNASKILILNENQQEIASFALDGTMFDKERAVMALDIYQKDNIWRINAVGQGFNGGLAKLIEHFGGEVANNSSSSTAIPTPTGTPISPNSTPTTVQQPTIAPNVGSSNVGNSIDLKKKISLEKAQKTGSQSIIDLTKKSLVQLEKKNLLNVQARVALVLDASGSMNWQYKNGDVQKIVDRLMPLAINFDDDGSFECWAFAQHTQRLEDVTLVNVNNFINTTNRGWSNWSVGARINEEIPAIKAVIDFYTGVQIDNQTSHQKSGGRFLSGLFGQSSTANSQPSVTPPATLLTTPHNQLPVYVLFISDGGVGSSRQMQNILTQCANLPIFWQFVGVGGSNYGVLEKLDDMTGRVVDNCNFFSLDNITSVSDERLYELLLEEFPSWLTACKRLGILA